MPDASCHRSTGGAAKRAANQGRAPPVTYSSFEAFGYLDTGRQSRDSKTRRAIVKLLKTEGASDASRLAARLGLTPMAVRQHLYQLQREKLVTAEERPVPLGRPAKYWHLTREADRLFPDAYAEVSLALLDALGDAYGPEGLDRVLEARSARQKADYVRRIDPGASLAEKLEQLARTRTEEGYMAEVKPD